MTLARRRPLAGKRILVTGAARGLGFELATVLAARGATLSLVGLEPDLLQARARTLGPSHIWFEANVTDQAAIDDAVAGTVAALGGIDAVITNAGVANNGTLAGGPVEAHIRTIDVNVNGTIRTVSACLPHLIESRGYALLIASVGSLAAFPGLGTYSASKAAVEHLANALRLELAHTGVQVGSAHPVFLDTDLVRDSDADSRAFSDARQRLPGPVGSTYSPTKCAEALADAVAKRKRRVYIPRSIVVMQILRPLLLSALGDAVIKRQLRTWEYIPALEEEIAAHGRAFGSSSVESSESAVGSGHTGG